MRRQQTSIGNTVLTTLMPSLTSSPHRLPRRDIREAAATAAAPASMEAPVRKSTLPEPASPVPTRMTSSPTKEQQESVASAFTEEDILKISNIKTHAIEDEQQKGDDEEAQEEKTQI